MNFQLSVRYLVAASICACVSWTGGVVGALTRGKRRLVDRAGGLHRGEADGQGEALQPGVLTGVGEMYSIQQRAAAGCAASLLIAWL